MERELIVSRDVTEISQNSRRTPEITENIQRIPAKDGSDETSKLAFSSATEQAFPPRLTAGYHLHLPLQYPMT